MSETDVKAAAAALNRIGMVLGALYAAQMGDADQGTKAMALSRCGFSNTEIAGLLGSTTNAINVALHRGRKTAKRTTPRKKKAARRPKSKHR